MSESTHKQRWAMQMGGAMCHKRQALLPQAGGMGAEGKPGLTVVEAKSMFVLDWITQSFSVTGSISLRGAPMGNGQGLRAPGFRSTIAPVAYMGNCMPRLAKNRSLSRSAPTRPPSRAVEWAVSPRKGRVCVCARVREREHARARLAAFRQS